MCTWEMSSTVVAFDYESSVLTENTGMEKRIIGRNEVPGASWFTNDLRWFENKEHNFLGICGKYLRITFIEFRFYGLVH